MNFIRHLRSVIAAMHTGRWQPSPLPARRSKLHCRCCRDRNAGSRAAVIWGLLVALLLAACNGGRDERAAGARPVFTMATVAVATNFHPAAGDLEAMFESATGHELTLVSGSTGKLYAQIENGAPFDVLLAADSERPRRLETQGLAIDGSRFVYATGRLSLWSPDPAALAGGGRAVLERADFEHLAIANPALAPYGLAARQVLERLGLWKTLAPRIVMGENIGQAHALVATGNAGLGFVARAYLQRDPVGSSWAVPATLHDPIRQEAVLLRHGERNAAARAFLEFLQGDAARARIAAFGYGSD